MNTTDKRATAARRGAGHVRGGHGRRRRGSSGGGGGGGSGGGGRGDVGKMKSGEAIAAATPALLELRRALVTQAASIRGLQQRRAAERAAAAEGAAAGTLYEPDEDCCVCYETLDQPNAVVTECGHVYHRACIESAFENSRQGNALRAGHGGNCPICRQWIDRASLIKINNGLPTRREFAIAAVKPEGDVVDLDSDADTAGLGFSPSRAPSPGSAGGPRKRRRAKARKTTAEEAAEAMDVEIGETLKRGNVIMEKSFALVAMEGALAEEVASAHEKVQEAEAEVAAARKRAIDDIGRAKVEIRVREAKVEEERKEARADRRELAEKIAETQQRNDNLLIQISNAEQAVKDANAEKAKAEEAQVAQEERRERFQKLHASMLAKKDALGIDEVRQRELERENRVLRKQVDALRRQVRKATNQPPPPEVEASARMVGARQPVALDMDLLQDLVGVQDGTGHGGDDTGDDEEDDVVAAADAQFNKSISTIRRSEDEATVVVEPSPADRAKFARGLFGHLQAPQQHATAGICPPPPPSRRRRGGRQGASGVGLAAFRPATPAPPPKPGAIGAARTSAVKTLGQKRSFASPLSARNIPEVKKPKPASLARGSAVGVLPKKRNSKINSFFQPK